MRPLFYRAATHVLLQRQSHFARAAVPRSPDESTLHFTRPSRTSPPPRSNLTAQIHGQDHVIPRIASVLQRGELGLAPQGRPRGSFLLLGPTGVGKTEITIAFTRYLLGDEFLRQFQIGEARASLVIHAIELHFHGGVAVTQVFRHAPVEERAKRECVALRRTRHDASLRSVVERLAVLNGDIRRSNVAHRRCKIAEDVALAVCAGFAETIGVEFVLNESLNLRCHCAGRLEFWAIENLLRALHRFRIVACFESDVTTPPIHLLGKPIDLSTQIDASDFAVSLEHPHIFFPPCQSPAPRREQFD